MESCGRPSTTQILLLATSSAVTAVLYSVYQRKAATVKRLKEARKISIDKNLRTVLSEAPGKCVPYAVVKGVVRSVKDTLSSQFVDNSKGVIERLTLREKLLWNRTTDLWIVREVIHQRTRSVPFDLCSHDDSITASVRVVRPLEASELNLETTYETFHPTVRSLSNITGHFISSEQPQGIWETEEMLKLGDCVTGVGELVLDNNLVKLQPPKPGLNYFLSRQDYGSLLDKQERSVRVWRLLVGVCGLAACGTLCYILWRQWALWRKRQQECRAFKEYKEEQRRRMKELEMDEDAVPASACSVCLISQRNCVFLECGHVCTCKPCYQALPFPKKCPICRALIDRVIPLYNC